jgi:hypothetical protein
MTQPGPIAACPITANGPMLTLSAMRAPGEMMALGCTPDKTASV